MNPIDAQWVRIIDPTDLYARRLGVILGQDGETLSLLYVDTPAGWTGTPARDVVIHGHGGTLVGEARKPNPAAVVITDDADVTVHATDNVDVFVYPAEETAENLRRDADMLDERGMTEAARDVRRLAAGEP